MHTETITDEESLDAIRKMFYQEIAEFKREHRRIDKAIKNRLWLIAKTKSDNLYTQTIESNIK